jgi:protein TonB
MSAASAAQPQSSPLAAAVFGDRTLAGGRIWAWVLASSLALHLAMGLGMAWLRAAERAPLAAEPIEIAWEPLAPPPPPPEPPRPVEEPQPATPRPAVAAKAVRVKAKAPAAAPKSPARAGQIVAHSEPAAAEDAPPADAFATGEGERYAGGFTSSSGQSEAPVLTAPDPEPAAPAVDVALLTRGFLQRVREEIARRHRYPLAALRMAAQGAVTVGFCIEADGSFSGVSVRRSSGFRILDEAALEEVRGSSGRQARPVELGSLVLKTELVLRFELNG